MDDSQPTVAYIPDKDRDSGASTGVSRAKVGLIEGQGRGFAEETAELLRRRLRAATLAMTVAFGASFILLLPCGAPFFVFRCLTLLLLLSVLFVLRGEREFSLGRLRAVELFVFAAIAVQLMVMMYSRMAWFIGEGDEVSALASQNAFHAAFVIVLFTYAIFIPNPWKRACLVLFTLACAPYLVMFLLCWGVPGAGDILTSAQTEKSLPLPFVAAVIAAFGAHTIGTVRHEAFKARQFGQYRLKEKIGSGGMGEVYHAEHRMLKRPCALKLIRAESAAAADVVRRFEKEVRATARLSHFNTVEIFDYGRTEDGTFYYVMEFLPGLTLEQLVRRYGPLSPGRAVYLLSQTCGSLEEAHAAGLIHRDIKPANIFAAKKGGMYDVAKLLDFGLVRETDGAAKGGAAPRREGFSGSPLYMAPEQVTSYESVDGRCDIYSLGAVAYFLVTGEPPFVGFSVSEVLRAHANEDVLPPSKVAPSVPGDLEAVIMRCLSKDPRERYADASSLKQALLACRCAAEWNDDAAREWWKRHEAEKADLPDEGTDGIPLRPKSPDTTRETADFNASTQE